MTPRVAIVIVNYNGAAFLDELAASLERVQYANRRLVLIDNASTDGSGARLASLFPGAQVMLNDRNLGLAPALNQALDICLNGPQTFPLSVDGEGDRGGEVVPDYVLLLNPDTTHERDFLARLVESADEGTIVVPKILSSYDHSRINTHAGGFDWNRGLFRDTHDGLPDGPETSRRREIETASFCCMLIPSSAFDAVGRIDETLAMYYEDTDFVERARKAGFRVRFEPSARIYHREGGSSGGKESPFKHYYATRNRPYVVRKHVSKARYALFTAYYLTTRLSKLAASALHRDRPMLRAQLLAVRDFYTGRMGMTYQPSDFVGPSLD